MGSSSTLVVVEWNSPQPYRYFDDVTIFSESCTYQKICYYAWVTVSRELKRLAIGWWGLWKCVAPTLGIRRGFDYPATLGIQLGFVNPARLGSFSSSRLIFLLQIEQVWFALRSPKCIRVRQNVFVWNLVKPPPNRPVSLESFLLDKPWVLGDNPQTFGWI